LTPSEHAGRLIVYAAKLNSSGGRGGIVGEYFRKAGLRTGNVKQGVILVDVTEARFERFVVHVSMEVFPNISGHDAGNDRPGACVIVRCCKLSAPSFAGDSFPHPDKIVHDSAPVVVGTDLTSGNGGGGYCVHLNIANALPLSVTAGQCVISSISKSAYTSPSHSAQLDSNEILTVVASPPAAGSFRPPYAGTNRSVVAGITKDDIDYDALQNVTPVGGDPDMDDLAALLAGPMISLGNSYSAVHYLCGTNNAPDGVTIYGRSFSGYTSSAALALQLAASDAEKEALAIALIQIGIDVYGVVQAGGAFTANGGHAGGRKAPLVWAGKLLGSSEILAYAGGMNRFFENGGFFFINQRVVDETRYSDTLTPPLTPDQEYWQEDYPSGAIGLGEWSGSGNGATNTAGWNWGLKYRDVACPNLTGAALAVHIMGVEDEWSHNGETYSYYGGIHANDNNAGAFMAYYMATERNGFTSFANIQREAAPGDISDWVLAMWDE